MDMETDKKMNAENKINTEQKMSMEQFAESTRERLEQQGQFEKVSLQKVLKNNGVTRWGLLLYSAGSNIAPTIYLEPFYEAYEHGADMEELIEKICKYGGAPCKSADMPFLLKFSKAKDKVCMKLINREANGGLLEKVPYREFLDLAVVYYIDYNNPQIGAGTIQIYNSHMEMWGVTEEDLWEAASSNTPERKPGRVESMEDILAEMFAEQGNRDRECSCCRGKGPLLMLVITNKERLYGATVVLYSGMLKQAADQADSDLFILPSSLHEVIAVPVAEGTGAVELRKMVMEVNRTQLQPEDVLSNNVYIYRKEQDRLEIA